MELAQTARHKHHTTGRDISHLALGQANLSNREVIDIMSRWLYVRHISNRPVVFTIIVIGLMGEFAIRNYCSVFG